MSGIQITDNGIPTSVAASVSSQVLLSANGSRRFASVYNDSTAVLYLLLSSTAASTTAYTVQVASNGYFEVPTEYTGQINGIWAAANGNARVTETS